MGFGNCVLTLAAPENIEAVGDAGILYQDEKDLTQKLQRVLRDGSLVQAYRNRAQARAKQHYDWDDVVDQYEQLFAEMAGIPLSENQAPTIRESLACKTTTSGAASKPAAG
jgi:glycosyltransferase involved in cell wall biosynthesis